MSKEMVVSATPHETRVAILEDGQLCEIYIEREKEFALVGSIYKGRVTRVLPGMQSAFVDIGLDSDAFLYVSDFLENMEEYDHVLTTVEEKVTKMEQQGGQVFTPEPAPAPEPPRDVPPAESAAAPVTLPGETIQPRQGPPSSYTPREPREFDRRGGRGPRNFGRGGDRGRGGRWGRGRGGRDRGGPHGRNLPPSKYASPRHYEPAPPPSGEPILLPGESLAKYREHGPAGTAGMPTEAGAAPPQPELNADQFARTPDSPDVFAAPQEGGEGAFGAAEPGLGDAGLWITPLSAEGEEAAADLRITGVPADSAEYAAEEFAGLFEHPAEPEHAEHVESGEAGAGEHDLSDEEVMALSEQLAEAKHEEAHDQIETPELAGETETEAEAEAEAEESSQAESEEEAHEEAHEEAAALEEEHPEEVHEFAAEEAEPAEPAEEPSRFEPAETEPPSRGESDERMVRTDDRSRARFQRPMRRGGRHHRERGGGRRPYRPMRHAAPRRIQLISELLKAGQEIIVQIAKEPLGKKGARITSHVALPGRFLVYMPTVDHIGVSRKIASAEERARLRRIVNEAKTGFPGGFIVRTAADRASDEEIRADVEFLGRTWETIKKQSEQRRAPALLHRDLNLVERLLRDYLSEDYTAIWVDGEEDYGKVLEFVSRFQPKLVNRVKMYVKESPIFEEFGIQQELDKALRPKVWLKSGGYIVINHTEALVAIDVNTGKFVGKGSTRLEDTIVRTNLEAVKEIVRQIRLRDLGGIIVVDFIDMEERRNREKVIFALDQALRADRAPSKALGFNEFGLVAITRKRTKQALERVLCQPCPYCTGSGMVKSVPTICFEIQTEARKMAADLDAQSLTLRVNPEIAKALKTRESALIEELEGATRKSVIIQSDPTLHWEQYDIY